MPNIVTQSQNRTIDLSNNTAMLPAYLTGLPSVVGKIPVGNNRNRIGLKGREFHVFKGGVEEGVLDTKYADVIVVGAIPAVSRLYYQGRYIDGENKAPACYSVDGVKPAADVRTPQCTTCMACPQNVAGSGISGEVDAQGKSRACGFFRRLAIILVGDTDRTVYQLDVKAQGLFDKKGDPANNKYSFNEYAKKLAAANNGAGIDIGYVITRISFDPNVSVPKLFFQPLDYITKEEASTVVDLIETGAIKPALEMSMQTVDLSQEVPQQTSEPARRVASAPVAQGAVEEVQEEPAVDRPTLGQAAPVQQVAQPRAAVRPATRVVSRPTQVSQVQMPPEDEPEPSRTASAPRIASRTVQAARAATPAPAQGDMQGEIDDLLAQLE